jgi:lactoylglutathione lyase
VPETRGVHHLGLSVLDLDSSILFFTEALGWNETSRDSSYPRASISDGHLRLSLWQVDRRLRVELFNRRKNVGLHHLALEVDSEERLNALAQSLSRWPAVVIEFLPEKMGDGPSKHMILHEPGGNRIELIWPGR